MNNLDIPSHDVFSSAQGSRPKTTGKAPARSVRGYAGPGIGPGELTPPSSGSQSEREPPSMLMSPPPEDVLRSARAKSSDLRVSASPRKQKTFRLSARDGHPSTAKRKRVQVIHAEQPPSPRTTNIASSSRVTIDATPNPKPRKQSKRNLVYSAGSTTPMASPTKPSRSRAAASELRSNLLQSPHVSNPHADYIPPLQEVSRQSLSRRRSVTPLPQYEPPQDRFTPPREVVYTPVPSVSKSSKRKSMPWSRSSPKDKGKERRLTIQIKKELPDIDLSEPLPPASPTDDPLLLYGPPLHTSSRKKASRTSLGTTATYSRQTPPMSSSSPPFGPVDEGTQLLELNMTGMDLIIDTSDIFDDSRGAESATDAFNFGSDGADLSSEDEDTSRPETEKAGEFVDSYKVHAVPIKADPPSSVTRERMDRWGRPVSPFPLEARQSSILDPRLDEQAEHLRLSSPLVTNDYLADDPSHKPPSPCASSSRSPPSSPSQVESSPPQPSPASSRRGQRLSQVSSPQSVVSSECDEELYEGHDTIIEYDIPLAGDDNSSVGSSRTSANQNDSYGQPGELESDFEDMYAGSPSSAHPHSVQQPSTDGSPGTHSELPLDDEVAVDEEDAESVVRELSHEPNFRDDEPDDGADRVYLRPATPQSSSMHVISSPHNPFHVLSPPTAGQPIDSQQYHAPTLTGAVFASQVKVADFTDTSAQEDDEDSDLADLDPGVVKITSEDPMAAARAAAILRLHKYDCLEAPPAIKHAQSLRESVLKKTRQKSCLQSGITKGTSSAPRHRTLTRSMNSVKLSRPDVSLLDLLREAEETLIMEEDGPIMDLSPISSTSYGNRTSVFKTPGYASAYRGNSLPDPQVLSEPRDWTKTDWKRLDGCYTDERLALGEQLGLEVGSLGPAEDVGIDRVIDRFIRLMGGEDIVSTLGSSWTRDNLYKRARALRRKQSSGKVAPPVLSPSANSGDNHWTPQHYSVHMSPNSSLYEDLLPQFNFLSSRDTLRRSVRYAEPGNDASVVLDDSFIAHLHSDTSTRPLDPSSIKTPLPGPTPQSLTSKVKGLIFSYLPKSVKAPPSKVYDGSKAPRLPVPPPELFDKPRPPIATPLPKSAPKPPHPKDIVQLRHVPCSQETTIPGPSHARTGSSASLNLSFSRERRDSGASVKDLVKTFESIEKKQAKECESLKALELRKRRSIQNWNESRAPRSGPVWRP